MFIISYHLIKLKLYRSNEFKYLTETLKQYIFFFYSNSKLTKAVTNVKKTSTQKVIETCNTANSTVVVQKAY